MAFYLPMEGGAANAAKDYSGNGITAAVNGNPVWNATAGHDGRGAWVLDGSDDLSGGENFPVSSSYTITAWVYRTGSGNNGGNNIMAGDANPGGHAFWAPDSYGNKLSAGHNGTWNSVQDPVVLGLNTWYFVSLTYNSATGQMVLYKNGLQVSSATVTAQATDATISVGSFGYTNGYMWKGTLDDVRIYKRALSAEQVASLFTTGHNVIKHTETEVGDSWQARVTPFSATDAGSTYESSTIVIQGAAVPPEITSTPVTDAAIGELYSYDVEATGNPAPEYILWINPTGMTIDEITGLIEWTPAASGTVPVGVVAFNTAGADTQIYEITVPELPGVTNLVLTSTFGRFATTDELLCEFDLAGPAVTSATAWYVGNSPLSPLMTLYLPAEGGAANALKDYSGNGFHATAHGNPVWLATGGHDGHGAWSLDGTGDDLSAGEHFPTGASYTKTAWVYRTGSGQNGGNNIVAGNDNTGGHAFWAPDHFGNKLSAGHNAVWDIVQDAVPLGLNQWYFVAVSFDYATGLMVLYKDGVIVDSAVVPPSDLNVMDATISVGSFGAANGWMWKGQLDDVRVYNRALSAEQVSALCNRGSNVIAPEETEIGQLWMACVTPFSAAAAGETACTDTITVMDETVPVFVRSIESRWIDNRVEIAWALRDASAGLSFDIYRSDNAVSQFVRLQDAEITRRGDEYVFTDESAVPGKSYTYRVSVLEGGEEVASFETSPPAAALRFALEQNHPNPFNPVTNIPFSLDTEADLTLRVYDISGRLVRKLIDRRMSAGVHAEEWDGRSDTGGEVASGIYFYRLTAGERTLTRKAVFLK
jgi:fibronectin type 3 domain-containing protein